MLALIARRRAAACGFATIAGFCTATQGAQAQPAENITVMGQAGPVLDQPIVQLALSGDDLRKDGITTLADLGQVVPGLRVDRYGAALAPVMRGIGVQNFLGPGIDSDIAVYVDGFHQSGLDGFFDFADVTRVYVLKGPQGTQFGRNAIGGAILLTTADPDFASHGTVAASYGSFNDRRLQGYYTAGLSSTLAVNLSAGWRQSDNYFTDIATGNPSAPIRSLSLRGKLLYQPSADMRFILAAQFSDTDDPTSLAYSVRNPVASFYRDMFGVPEVHTQIPYKTSLGHRIAAEPKVWSLGLTGEMNLGWATLTTRSQFRKERGHAQVDLDGTSIAYFDVDYLSLDQTISQELDLAGKNDGPLQWQAGLYYENGLGSLFDNSRQDIFGTGIETGLFKSELRVATDSVALFGDVTYALADDWTIAAGARATHERKSMRSSFLLAPISATGSGSWDNATPRLALRHTLGPDANIYASFTQGIKSGNYDFLAVGPQAPTRAERVTQYEVGYKRADADWSIGSAAYLSDYRDLQAFTYFSSCGCFHLANAPRARVYGAELSVSRTLNENITIHANGAWTHARYRDFTGENPTGLPFIPPIYGYATAPTSFAGGAMFRSPDWTGNFGLDWRIPSDMGEWNAAANLYLTSRVPFTPDRQLSQAGYGLLNLSLGWTPDRVWTVTASGQNVTGQRYQNFSAEGFLGNSIVYGAPASWTLRIARSF